MASFVEAVFWDDARRGVPTSTVSADLALLLLGAWLAGALVVAAGFTERAEITG